MSQRKISISIIEYLQTQTKAWGINFFLSFHLCYRTTVLKFCLYALSVCIKGGALLGLQVGAKVAVVEILRKVNGDWRGSKSVVEKVVQALRIGKVILLWSGTARQEDARGPALGLSEIADWGGRRRRPGLCRSEFSANRISLDFRFRWQTRRTKRLLQ